MYLPFSLFVFALMYTVGAFECPKDVGCSDCLRGIEDVYKMNCATTKNGVVELQIKPDNYVRLICRNSANWTKFHLGNSRRINGVKLMSFDRCNLPESNELGSMAKRLLNDEMEKLYFSSSIKYSSNLTRETLRGLGNLVELTLTSMDLNGIKADVFQDLKNLKIVNLQNTRLRRLPDNLFGPTSVESIELSTNELTSLDSNMFGELKNLRLLNLWNNKLVKISPNTFDGLASLETLNLRRNRLESLPNDVFRRLGDLKVLRLSENNFRPASLPEDLLKNCKNLRSIEIIQNRKNVTVLPDGFFSNLTQLTSVKLRKIGLKSLRENLFWGSINLNNVSLERNYLMTLPERIFRDNHHLLTLDLNFNELTSLPDGVFANLRELVKLDLSRNHLTAINEHLFSSLTSLRELNLERNNVIKIHQQALASLQILRIARFSYNLLTLETAEMTLESPFEPLQLIEELHLDHNNISNIYVDWMYSMNSIRVLNLSYNGLQFLMHEDLQFLSENLHVDLTHNNISHIYMKGVESWGAERTFSRNLVVSIEDNPIECDCDLYDVLRYFEDRLHPNVKNAFHLNIGQTRCNAPKELKNTRIADLKSKTLKCDFDDPQLKGSCPDRCRCYMRPENNACVINCANKGLLQVPRSIDCPRDHSIELNFSSNSLGAMPNLNQPGYNKVTVLILDHNNISEISHNVLSSKLKVLRLNDNDLTRIDEDVIDFFNNSTELTELSLDGNPWLCDCETRELLTFVQEKSVAMPDLQRVTCASEEKAMFQMTPDELCWSNVGWIMGGCIVAFFGIIVGILSALYYRYQREIKVWLYAKNWCLWLVTENGLDKDKLFDAFISYSHKDEDFVVNDLIPNLEAGPRPFKLCVHYRDWLAGEWIPKQIARSVQQSRRTIVVLSPNFLESVWGRMEFRAAHSQALSEGRARVIVILYGEIGPTDDLDPELKAYLSMNTYVKWGDPWFWQRLKYAMPHPAQLTERTFQRNVFEASQPPVDISSSKGGLVNSVGDSNTRTNAVTTLSADCVEIIISPD